MHTIEYFMWGYQAHFRITAQSAAESLFGLLDDQLNPTVFLLGLLERPRDDRHAVCLEPKDTDFNVDNFKDVPALAQQLHATSKEHNVFRSDHASHQRHLNDIAEDAYREAVHKVIEGKSNVRSRVSFVSKPVSVADYAVFVILELDKKQFEKHYALTKTHVNDYFRVSRSLLESTIDLCLQRCSQSLRRPNPGEDLSRPFDNSEALLRKAGEQLMYTLSWAGNTVGQNNLFDSLNIISSLRYEGNESLGQLIISEPHHPNVTITVELAKPVALSEYRKIRKLLQTVDQSTSIISDGNEVFGLGRLTGQYNPQDESLYIIQFVDHYHWMATHNNQPLMRCKYGLPGLVREGIDRGTFQDICTRLFAIAKPRINQLYEIAMAAIHQQHGALVVISDGAAAEAERLKNQSFPIKPLPLTTQNVLSFSAIDGAVLVDTKGICHAIGVILDGPATSKGDASRGSRYNSAVRYVEFIKPTYPCIIIVVSEDGMVDLIPNLKPQIQRSTIDDRIQQLLEISQQADPDRKHFYKLNSFFVENAFYLSEEDCKLINEHRKSIEGKLAADGSLTITRPDLYPDEDMDNSFYL